MTNILVITPVNHIQGVRKIINSCGHADYIDDPSYEEVEKIIHKYHVIFTNPNKSKVFIGKELINKASNLKVICTASTGTNHIDIEYTKKLNIKVISLTNQRKIINLISSTAELAFSLTLASLRHLINAHNSVIDGLWDYENFIGRQMNFLTIGVIGYGRLGKKYSNYCRAFNSNIVVYDPYKKIRNKNIKQVETIEELVECSNIIALHVHVTNETKLMINKNLLRLMKKDVIIINTSRGDIIDEDSLVSFLKKNNMARVATDVLSDEIRNKKNSKLLKYAKESNQVLITPHIGGMCKEAQFIAYNHAAKLLKKYLN